MAIWDRLGKLEKCAAVIISVLTALALTIKSWTMTVTEPVARRVVVESMSPILSRLDAIREEQMYRRWVDSRLLSPDSIEAREREWIRYKIQMRFTETEGGK